MNRISKIFKRTQSQNRAALIIFASVGYPTLDDSEKVIEDAIANGADIVELGVPFSDPMADGKVICNASLQALKEHVNLPKVLELAGRIRARHQEVGLILSSYMNPMYNYGLEELCATAARQGIDGILAIDLPLEEQDELRAPCERYKLHLISLVAPNTPRQRMQEIAENASGFIYYISVRGEGTTDVPDVLLAKLAELKSVSQVPVIADLGTSDGAGAGRVAQCADGVVVGSAFVSASIKQVQAAQLLKELAENLKQNHHDR